MKITGQFDVCISLPTIIEKEKIYTKQRQNTKKRLKQEKSAAVHHDVVVSLRKLGMKTSEAKQLIKHYLFNHVGEDLGDDKIFQDLVLTLKKK